MPHFTLVGEPFDGEGLTFAFEDELEEDYRDLINGFERGIGEYKRMCEDLGYELGGLHLRIIKYFIPVDCAEYANHVAMRSALQHVFGISHDEYERWRFPDHPE